MLTHNGVGKNTKYRKENRKISCSFSVNYHIFTMGKFHKFYSAAILLAVQSAASAKAIPAVCQSVRRSVRLSHAGTPARKMNIGPCSLHCKVQKHSSFLTRTMVGGDVPYHLKYALKVTHFF